MMRLLLVLLGGLVAGGIIHIVVILLVPDFATRDAWTTIGRFGPDGAFHLLPPVTPAGEPLPDLDPRMAHAACRFSLAEAPVRIRARLPGEFWSLAVFDRRGSNIYSLNDRTAERSDIDLVIATPRQMLGLRDEPIPALARTIVIELPISEGFLLIRAFVPDRTMAPSTERALAAAQCGAPLTAE